MTQNYKFSSMSIQFLIAVTNGIWNLKLTNAGLCENAVVKLAFEIPIYETSFATICLLY